MGCKVAPKNKCKSQHDADAAGCIADFDTALDRAGYGTFSRAALAACAGAFFTTGVENCVMSYVLPAARCELALTTYHAGLVKMAFMCGGVASAFFWGVAGDVFGRQRMLSLTLMMNGILTAAQSVVSDYRVLIAARSINGFLIGGPSTLVFPYLSDLVGARRRQVYLSCTGTSFVAAWLVLPAIAWLILPIRATAPTTMPVYSWRLFLLLAGVPALVSGILVAVLPESPRLLADTGRGADAVRILAKIYRGNGGKGKFPVTRLLPEQGSLAKAAGSRDLFLNVMRQLKQFVSRGLAVRSSLVLFMFFANMSAGFGLNLWIPELLVRMDSNPCTGNASTTDHPSTARLPTAEYNETRPGLPAEPCNEYMSEGIYTSGLIVGACCVLGNALCAFLAHGGARGVQRASAACALACAGACACLATCVCSCRAHGLAVAAAAALNATSLNGNVLLMQLLMHVLPANLCGLGVCWGAWWGRAGGLLSNLAIGALLDVTCAAPFLAVAACLLASVGAIMFIKMEDTQQRKEERSDHDREADKYAVTHM